MLLPLNKAVVIKTIIGRELIILCGTWMPMVTAFCIPLSLPPPSFPPHSSPSLPPPSLPPLCVLQFYIFSPFKRAIWYIVATCWLELNVMLISCSYIATLTHWDCWQTAHLSTTFIFCGCGIYCMVLGRHIMYTDLVYFQGNPCAGDSSKERFGWSRVATS